MQSKCSAHHITLRRQLSAIDREMYVDLYRNWAQARVKSDHEKQNPPENWRLISVQLVFQNYSEWAVLGTFDHDLGKLSFLPQKIGILNLVMKYNWSPKCGSISIIKQTWNMTFIGLGPSFRVLNQWLARTQRGNWCVFITTQSHARRHVCETSLDS